METRVIMANMKDCISPTNSSKNKNGKGTIYGAKKKIIVSRTSPANTFPNNRKDNEIIFAASEISSKIPIKKFIGFEKLRYLPICLNVPTAAMPKIFVIITEITAKAKVKFKSAAGERNNGTSEWPFSNIKDPTPGKIPNKLEHIIKRNIVAIKGKYLSAFSFVPRVDSISPSNPSMPISATDCSFPGIILIFL